MRYQIDPDDNNRFDQKSLEQRGFTNIRKGYWLGLSNQPQTFVFETDNHESVRKMARAYLVWCLTTNQWVSPSFEYCKPGFEIK